MADPHIEDRLPDFVLGLLSGEERALVEAHLAGCEACRGAARTLQDAVGLAAVGLGSPSGGREQLLQALEGGRRFEQFVPQVAGLFDLSEDAARTLLAQIDDAQAWSEGPAPGCTLIPVMPGPNCRGQIVSLLKLEPAATFPEHSHGDEEQVLVLEGGYLDSTGIEVWRGELDVRARGTSHSFVALEGPACICATVSSFPDDS